MILINFNLIISIIWKIMKKNINQTLLKMKVMIKVTKLVYQMVKVINKMIINMIMKQKARKIINYL